MRRICVRFVCREDGAREGGEGDVFCEVDGFLERDAQPVRDLAHNVGAVERENANVVAARVTQTA